jgi:Lamin Tail Domain/Secretion system C-terminal sorting domain
MKRLTPFFFLTFLVNLINAQVVINEVQAKPNPSSTAQVDQSMAHTTPGYGREFIEIYNTGCTSVDIGCWVIATESWGTSTRDGSYRIPTGTIIGPHSFFSIGGALAGADVDLSALLIASDAHIATGSSTRWYMDNGDAYVALFDDSGTPIDAVFWTTSSGESSKWATDSDLDDPVSQIPNPGTCPAIASFADPSDANLTAVVEYAGQSPSIGNSLSRIQDGGAWTNTGTPSVSATNDIFEPCLILPITLLNFDGKKVDNFNQLYWTTASEINNDYFVLERSYDTKSFNQIAVIEGAGNSTSNINYIENDKFFDLNQTVSYYRLKQVDFDGIYSYSNIVSIDNKANNIGFNIYPNPTSNYITFYSNSSLPIFYQLISIDGKIVKEGSFINHKKIELSNLSNGTYFIKAISNEKIFLEKIIKTK